MKHKGHVPVPWTGTLHYELFQEKGQEPFIRWEIRTTHYDLVEKGAVSGHTVRGCMKNFREQCKQLSSSYGVQIRIP